MQRVQRLGVLTLILVGLWSRPAEAGLKDWLEELSGPGPFHNNGIGNLMFTFCQNETLVQADESKKPCIFVDLRQLVNDEDDNFRQTIGKVSVTIADFGITYRPLARVPIQIGAGAGFIRFHSEPTGADQKNTIKFAAVAPRLQVTPLEYVGKIPLVNRHRMLRNSTRVVKFYATYLFIPGRLQGDKDFGAAGSTFDAKHERLDSYGFLLDFIELVRP